jgi:hypothetical protein
MRMLPSRKLVLWLSCTLAIAACNPSPRVDADADAGPDVDAGPLWFSDCIAPAAVETTPNDINDISDEEWSARLQNPTPPPPTGDAFVDQAVAWMVARPDARALVQAAGAITDDGEVSVTRLRAALMRFDACSKRHPTTLDEFRAQWWDERTLRTDEFEIVASSPKQQRRRIGREASAGVFLAQTLDDADNVLETEILLTDQRPDGALEFLAYDEDGVLRATSPFPVDGVTTELPAPFVCMQCHRSETRGFVEVHPAPAGPPPP